MAYNGKTVQIDGIVEKAFRDSGLHDIDWEAAIEWTAELLGLLGIPATKVDKVTNGLHGGQPPLVVQDYRVRLPDDLEDIVSARKIMVDSSGNPTSFQSMVESSDVFHTSDATMITSSLAHFDPTLRITYVEGDEIDQMYGDAQSNEVNKELESDRVEGGTYKIDGQFLFTSFKEGYIELAYRGFPIDDRGLPVVPADPKFLTALKYHLIFHCDWLAWRSQPASPGLKAVVNDSEARRDFYVAAARNKAHIPSIDKMEALKNQWIRSIPKINEHANGFKTLGVQEHRYNQYTRGRR